ncbi:MAG TPA: InlB B-repeat-containing protein, partial [Clostridiales bacterium]|nr:InlB B-repeat-containing protein [Clostridiales bacterium]
MNKTTTRRFMAWILTVAMLIGMLPMNALASDNPKDDSQSVFMGSFLDPDQSKGGAGSKGITPPQNTYTYIFKVDDEEEVERQSVKDGEYLIEPEAPVKPNHKFKGWFVGSNQIDFSQPISVPQEVPPVNTNIVANAKFEEVYYVFFMDGVGGEGEPNPRVFKTKEGKTGDTVTTSDVKLPIGSTQAVTGWYKDQALTDGPVGTNYTIGTVNQILWPKIETGNYLYFVSGENGTYIEPQFFLPGENTVAPNPPTRPGYDFSHWSTTQGGSAYTFGQPIIADVTLYAVWTAKTNTPYTVVFWKQSVNDDKNAADDVKTYDYAESVARTAATGATVSPTTADGNKNYQGFHYNSAKSTSVTVKGDGTTILNVYYDRNLLTIDFYRYQSSGWGGSWIIDQTMTGLYGQTLAKNGYTWPSEYRWRAQKNSGNTLTFLDSFIFDDLPDYGSKTHIKVYRQSLSGTAQIIHYKQALDGTWVVANTIQTNSGTFNFSNKYTGFTVTHYRADNGNWRSTSPGGSANYSNKLEVRHTRNSYNLAFYNYNTVARTENLKFEASLSSYASYRPSKPAELPDVYTFQGWYKDNAYSVPFDFATETMPSNDLMIYVKWAPPVFDGTFHVQMSGDDTPKEVTVTYNDTIDPATMPTVKDHEGNVLSQGDDGYTVTVPKDHKWIGWATKVDGNYITYNFNTLVQSDIELYPYYVDNAQFKVSYDAGSGTGTPPEDTKKYAKDTYADVMSPTDLTPPTGKVFLGWENKGVIYQPGDKIRVTGPMTLTAQWGVVPKKVDLVYNYNYGTNPATKTFGPFPVNSTVIVKELGDSDLGGWVAPENYEFVGWNTEADGSGTSFAAGDSAMIDAKNPNELYAIWAPVLTVTSGDGTWQYDGNSHTYQQYDLVYGDQTITGGEGELSFMLNDGKTVTITPEGKGADGVKTVSDNSDNNNTFSVEVDTSVPQGTHVSGTLTITPVTDKVTVTITENSGSFMYDGSLKTVNGYEVTSIS